jgi:FixJ family two-component response regulator
VQAFATSAEFLEAYDRAQPGCLLLDIAMPGLTGLELQEALTQRGGAPPIIFLTGRADIPMSVQAMKRGAIDFLTKPVRDTALLDAIQRALAKDAADRLFESSLEELRARIASLTPREREVLRHVVAGQLNKQIAGDLGIVEQTIKVHRSRVMEKMRVHSVAELVRVAGRLGLLDDQKEA